MKRAFHLGAEPEVCGGDIGRECNRKWITCSKGHAHIGKGINMAFRKIVFWLHLISGVFAGIIVLIMSGTGVALMYQKQITTWADKRQCSVQVPAGGAALPVQVLLERFQSARPEVRPAGVTLSSDPEMPAAITMGLNETVFVDPYTGTILGNGSAGVRSFFRTMTDWHRWLALSGPNRGIGRAVTGACNLMYLLLVITGLYLWFPRAWTRGIFRALSWFRLGLAGKARDSNWHYVFGFWCIVPLILIVMSGVVISYPWASNLVFQISGSKPPARMGPGGGRPQSGPVDFQGLDAILQTAKGQASDWKTIAFQVSATGDKTLAMTVDKSFGGQPQMRSTLTVDRKLNQIVQSEDFQNMDKGMKARMWMRFVHTGEYYGLMGQTIAGIASAAGVVLVWTGIALALHRCWAWMKRRSAVI